MLTTLVVLHMIVLHTVDGREIDVNAAQITHMREAHDDNADDKYFTKGVRCMLNLADSKYVTVAETCEAVRKLIEEINK